MDARSTVSAARALLFNAVLREICDFGAEPPFESEAD
jgi:hypothetical protein